MNAIYLKIVKLIKTGLTNLQIRNFKHLRRKKNGTICNLVMEKNKLKANFFSPEDIIEKKILYQGVHF